MTERMLEDLHSDVWGIGKSDFGSKKIHAVTPRGFELKIVWFLLAFSIQCL